MTSETGFASRLGRRDMGGGGDPRVPEMEYKSLKVISVKIRQSWNATGTRGRLLEIYLVFA